LEPFCFLIFEKIFDLESAAVTDNPQPAQSTVEVLDVTKICGTFPTFSGIQIARDNLHNTLETILESDIPLWLLRVPKELVRRLSWRSLLRAG
jgi:hypothetical protein